MPRKSVFSNLQVKEMKESIRTGEPITSLAERLAEKYNVSETSMRNKLYNLSQRTYKIAKWDGPKRRTKRMEEPQESAFVAKKVVLHTDHIRIYF